MIKTAAVPMAKRPRRLGSFSPSLALPRLLKTLDHYGLRPSYFGFVIAIFDLRQVIGHGREGHGQPRHAAHPARSGRPLNSASVTGECGRVSWSVAAGH